MVGILSGPGRIEILGKGRKKKKGGGGPVPGTPLVKIVKTVKTAWHSVVCLWPVF